MSNLKSGLKGFVRDVVYAPAAKKVLKKIPVVKGIYPPWERTHPVDLQYGIDTSGYVPIGKILADKSMAAKINPYGGSQPGIIRRALSTLGDIEDYALADIGCGKGRVTVIASEFPFKKVVGVELSAELAEIASVNASKVAAKFKHRPAITISRGNALEFDVPKGNLVVYMYHPFQKELMSQMVKRLENALETGVTHLFVVYHNPVFGELFDASPAFTRWFADTLPYDPSEIGYGPDVDDTVVVWQSVGGARPNPHPRANRKLVTVTPTLRVSLTA
jgi:predicted RNA methylase